MRVRTFSEVAGVLGERRGWRPGSGDAVLENPKLGRVHHVAICRDDGTPIYDQFLHIEPLGAVTVPRSRDGGVFGLVRVERPTIKSADRYRYPGLDFNDLGVASLEFPRGFPKKGEAGAQTAKREGEEELGSPILGVEQIGEITPNTTFHPHRIPVYQVIVNRHFQGTAPPDVNEKIFKVEWVHPDDLRLRIRSGQIHCALTLGAFALATAL